MTRTQSIVILALALSLVPGTARAEQPRSAQTKNPSIQETRTASSPARADAPDEYRLGPEDVVEVFVWKEPELSTTVTVRPDGRVDLPLVGSLVAAGKTSRELEQEAAAALREYVEVPVVTVVVREVNSPKISVLGEVQRPGRYAAKQETNIFDAIAMAGGFTEFAHRGKVTVIRKQGSSVRHHKVDVKRLLRKGRTPFQLEPGDTVHVD